MLVAYYFIDVEVPCIVKTNVETLRLRDTTAQNLILIKCFRGIHLVKEQSMGVFGKGTKYGVVS